MSKRKNKISVPITRQGKDISRVIFQIAEEGKYDIKFESSRCQVPLNFYKCIKYL